MGRVRTGRRGIRYLRAAGAWSGLFVLLLAAGTAPGSATTLPEAGEFGATASARAVSVVFLRQGFVIPNPVDVHFGSATTAFDGVPSYSAIADPIDPGFVKRAGGVTATVGVPIAIPDWPLGVELTTGKDSGANKPAAPGSPDGSVAVEAIPAEATASRGPGGRVDAIAAVTSLWVGTPGKAPAPPAAAAPNADPSDPGLVASSLWRAGEALRSVASRRPPEERTSQGQDGSKSVLSVASARAVSGSGWSNDALVGASSAHVAGVSLLDGAIRFGSVESSANARSALDGKSGRQAAVVVGEGRVADIPVTIDQRGVAVDEQRVGDGATRELQETLNAALDQAGVRITLVNQVGDGGTSRGAALEVAVRLANDQFREHNELAFRLGTVTAASSFVPQDSVLGEDSFPPDSSVGEEGLSPSDSGIGSSGDGESSNAGGPGSNPSPTTSSGMVANAPVFPVAGLRNAGGVPADLPAPDGGGPRLTAPPSDSGVSPAGSPSEMGLGPNAAPREDSERGVLAASPREEAPLSKGEGTVLLVLLSGQASLAVLMALRRV